MKSVSLCFAAMLLMFVSGGTTRSASADKGGDEPCKEFKMMIMTPSKDIDYKITIIPTPKDIDKAMVINPCKQAGEIVSLPPIIIQPKERNPFFKLTPFGIRNIFPLKDGFVRH